MLDFPSNPSLNDTYARWIWDGARWVYKLEAPSPLLVVSPTAPSNPISNLLWFDSSEGKLYLWYNDGNSSQWIGIGGGDYASLIVGPDAPDDPAPNQLWFNSSDGQLYLWFDDAAWISAAPMKAGPQGPPGEDGKDGATGPTGGTFVDADDNGLIYGRKDNDWGAAIVASDFVSGTRYFRLGPNLIQWGIEGGGSDRWLNFPTTFGAIPSVVLTSEGALGWDQTAPFSVSNISTTQFVIRPRYINNGGGGGVANQGFRWMAMGVAP